MRQPVRPEHEEREHREDEQLEGPDVEHRTRVRLAQSVCLAEDDLDGLLATRCRSTVTETVSPGSPARIATMSSSGPETG